MFERMHTLRKRVCWKYTHERRGCGTLNQYISQIQGIDQNLSRKVLKTRDSQNPAGIKTSPSAHASDVQNLKFLSSIKGLRSVRDHLSVWAGGQRDTETESLLTLREYRVVIPLDSPSPTGPSHSHTIHIQLALPDSSETSIQPCGSVWF